MFDAEPEGWEQTTLGSVLKGIVGGGTPARDVAAYWNGLIPWASVKDITSGTDLPLESVTAEAVANSASRVIPAGTNILAMRMAVGAVVRYRHDVAINQDLAALFPNERLDEDFLYFWLRANSEALKAVATGTTVKGLRKDALLRWPLTLPPLDEQRRIAEVLRSADNQIATQEAVVEQLRRVQWATFAAFLRSGDVCEHAAEISGWVTGRIEGVTRLPPGWKITRLVDVARLESGHTPSRKEPSYWDGGSIGWISLHDTQNLERPEITTSELMITEDGLKNSSARLLPKGTVCFSRTATVGKCVIMGRSMATSQDFANFICSDHLNNRYLLYLLRWMQPVWKQLASGSTHKTIYMPTFESLQIVLPTREAQDRIAGSMDALTGAIESGLAALDQQWRSRAGIVEELLSGRVRVPA